MFNAYRRKHAIGFKPGILHITGLLIIGLGILTNTSCRSTSHQVTRRTEPNLDPGWPRGNNFFTQVSYQQVKGQLPVLEGAEYVNDDEICMQCHEAYVKSFANNVHRGDSCESCHGPASRHVETQGREPGLIFSFKQADPITRAEACLQLPRRESVRRRRSVADFKACPVSRGLRPMPPRPLQCAPWNAPYRRTRRCRTVPKLDDN